jgi:2-dehydro-3-deoxygluconokinase
MVVDLLCIGEAMAEIRRTPGQDGFAVGFAGDTYNTAVYAKRILGASSQVGFSTRVGLDPLSAGFLRTASAHSIDTSAVERDASRNLGVYSVTTDATGERRFHYWRDQSAARQLDAATVVPARMLYLSGITLAILSPARRQALIDRLRALKDTCTIAFDGNYRPGLWEDVQTARTVTAQMWALADIALPGLDDEMALFGDDSEQAVIARFEQRDFDACVIKCGARGPLSLSHKDALPAFPPAASVVDTTAAGDSFNGGYLAARLMGKTEAARLMTGHRLAAQVVGAPGAIVDTVNPEQGEAP